MLNFLYLEIIRSCTEAYKRTHTHAWIQRDSQGVKQGQP